MDSGMFLGLQHAATEALHVNAEWIDSLNAEYSDRKKIVWEMLNLLKCSYDKKQAGLFQWAKVPSGIVNGSEYSDRILHEANVFITPGFIFGSNGDKFIRISLCSTKDLLDESLQRIKKIVPKQ